MKKPSIAVPQVLAVLVVLPVLAFALGYWTGSPEAPTRRGQARPKAHESPHAATAATNAPVRSTPTVVTSTSAVVTNAPPPPPKVLEPYVDFATKGRYLPPMGRRLLEIETLNVSNFVTEVRRIEPRNVVQFLARDERQYRGQRERWWENHNADDEETEELSGGCTRRGYRCKNELNAREITRVPVVTDDGGPTNGMFLVRAGDAYRVVCISDLGLSVRQSAGKLGVWVTSLTTGRPVPDAKIEVYSTANILLATGTSDAQGWCVPTRSARDEPFAVVVRSASGDDMTFLALKYSVMVEESPEARARKEYLKSAETAAFLWTERGIYRHDERIFLHGILRDGAMKAPKPMPVETRLLAPERKTVAAKTVMTDACGAFVCEDFTIPAERPSGTWTLEAKVPGKDGRVLGSRSVKVEEFAPPQIRVTIDAGASKHPTNLTFRISSEHLFGGPARGLACEGAVVFEDVPFVPAKLRGWSFGNETLGLRPCYRRLSQRVLDDTGKCPYFAPLFRDAGLPKAAVKATFEGTVFEDGGRPATARKTVIAHSYPHYIGSDLGSWLRLPKAGAPTLRFVLADPAGERVRGVHSLTCRLERVDTVYTYQRKWNGEHTWNASRVNVVVIPGDEIRTDPDGLATYRLPVRTCGDYILTVTDGVGGSFGRRFYLSDWGEDRAVRAKLSDPTEVTVTPDKPFYRVGETPHLLVKAPFPGWTMLSVQRDHEIYSEIFELTNATSEVVLRPVVREWAPDVEVCLSVVQSAAANTKRLAARAHGEATIAVRPLENEIPVRLSVTVGTGLVATVNAPGADRAVVTVVDEGINLLTSEPVADPVRFFATPRRGDHPLYDIFGRILPVVDEKLRQSGVKTGGGLGAEMLGRVSPEPSRRFRPLALWQTNVALTNGLGRAFFTLPEFVGEVRVTAVACSDVATGSAGVQRKIAPNLVIEPDAPRFAAPGDVFEVSMPLRNMTQAAGVVTYEIDGEAGKVEIAAGGMTNVLRTLRARTTPGIEEIRFRAEGLGEAHVQKIALPVRPAVAWRESTGIAKVGDEAALRAALKPGERIAVRRCETPADELAGAYRWLAEYPYGCLEQTCSRIFPLLSGALGAVSNREDCVAAGVSRVEAMIRARNFVMWPDCDYAPWDDEVSLYAAHFLVEADRSGVKPSAVSREKVLGFLERWAVSTNDEVSAYACHTLALAGCPDRDRMLALYDRAAALTALSRARLARAFALDHDFRRAAALLAFAYEPQDVREAAFTALALLAANPDDDRVFPLVTWLMRNRTPHRFSWGTTGENAHALLAIGAYYRAHPGKAREPYLVWRKLTLPDAATAKDDSAGIFASREYYRANGERADLADLVRGEMLFAELSLTTDVTRVVNDLVIEDLLPAAFEPVHSTVNLNLKPQPSSWVMRTDARDDRMLVFSKRFTLEKDHAAKVRYPVRVVTAGDFVLPGPSVEGMYDPRLHSRRASGRIVVRR